jgi:hypothetical protein
LQASIACIIGGRIVSLVGKANFKIKMGKFIILEMIVDQLLWILHDCFRCFRGNKNINVLNRSPAIHYLLDGTFIDFNFVLNGIIYLQYYLLTNDIYLQRFYFMQTIHKPQDVKKQHFTKMQEEVKKDVEKCLGAL